MTLLVQSTILQKMKTSPNLVIKNSNRQETTALDGEKPNKLVTVDLISTVDRLTKDEDDTKVEDSELELTRYKNNNKSVAKNILTNITFTLRIVVSLTILKRGYTYILKSKVNHGRNERTVLIPIQTTIRKVGDN